MAISRRSDRENGIRRGMPQKTKEDIRREIKAARAVLTEEREQFWNEQLFSCISRMPEITGASAVYSYVSYQHEADTLRLLDFFWQQGIRTAVPKVFGAGHMDFFVIASLADLELGRMGILEPRPDCPSAKDRSAVVITPGLAFDLCGRRIGYGGGYYDRFFAREPEHLRIGLAHSFQLYETIPAENNDMCVDCLIVSGEREGTRYEFERDRKTGTGCIQISEFPGDNREK